MRSLRSLALGTALIATAIASPALGADGAPPVPTFSTHIAKIFQRHCQECHRPGEIAPMSLLTYEETRPWVKSIRKEVAAKRMPPWHADAPPGEFKNDIGMTSEEIATITYWAEIGAPEGDPQFLPPPLEWKDSGWKLGKPDLELFPSEPFKVAPTGRDNDLYQCIVIPTGLGHDAWLQGIEYKPDNRRVVHHIIAFADNKGKAPERDAQTPEPGFPCGMGRDSGGMGNVIAIDSMLGGWAPGTPPLKYADGTGKPLSKGSNIILQMHFYNETGAEQLDKSGVGIHLAKGIIHKQSRAMPVVGSIRDFRIPAGDANAENKGKWAITRDVYIHSLAPHMHFLGKDMTFIADYPDGASKTLLTVPRYSFNWQKPYVFAEPKLLPRGSVLRTISHHDNSAENPNNPSKPPVDVKWGESTTEEMAIGWTGYYFADEDLNIEAK